MQNQKFKTANSTYISDNSPKPKVATLNPPKNQPLNPNPNPYFTNTYSSSSTAVRLDREHSVLRER